MVVTAHGRIGPLVHPNVGQVINSEKERARIQNQRAVEKIAHHLAKRPHREHASSENVQLMVDIVRGVATENAIKPVEEELRRDVAHVTTQHQPMEEVIVLKLPSKQKLATINIVLLMVNGAHGQLMAHVRCLVVEVRKSDYEAALIQCQNMVELNVMVTAYTNKNVLNSLAKSTVAIPRGPDIQAAAKLVDQEQRKEHVLATTQAQPMVVGIAKFLEQVQKRCFVTHKRAQFHFLVNIPLVLAKAVGSAYLVPAQEPL